LLAARRGPTLTARLLAVTGLLPVAGLGRLLAVAGLLAPGRPTLAARLLRCLLAVTRLGAPALVALLLALVGIGGWTSLPFRVVDAALPAGVGHVLGPPCAVVVTLGEASGRIRIPAGTGVRHRCSSSM